MPSNPHLWGVKHESKVPQFAEPLGCEENIFRFDVHVNERMVVKVLQGLRVQISLYFVC